MRFQVINNYSTTLASSLTDTATSMDVNDASAVPSSVSSDQPLALTLAPASASEPSFAQLEIVHVTSKSGNTLTISRGEQGSTAQDWDSGASVEGRLPAGIVNRFLQTASIEEQSAANANVDPDGFWLTTDPEDAAGPEGADCVVLGGAAKATNNRSVAIGQGKSYGPYSFAAGRSTTYTSAERSFAAGDDNTVGGRESAVLCGIRNDIDSDSHYAVILGGDNNDIKDETSGAVLGGRSNLVSARESVCLGGNGNSVSGLQSAAGGASCTVSSSRSMAFGYQCESSAYNAMSFGAYARGNNAYSVTVGGGYAGPYNSFAAGHQGLFLSRGLGTTDETPTDGGYQPGIKVGVEVGSLMAASGHVAASTEDGDRAAWKFDAFIYSDAGVANVAELNKTLIGSTGSGNNWDWDLIDDGSGESILQVEGTGEAGKTISWSFSLFCSHILGSSIS